MPSFIRSVSIISCIKIQEEKSNEIGSRKFHLIGGIQPDCGEEQLVHLGGEHVGEPLRRPVQRDPTEEEDRQDEVREEGGEVNHLECHPGLFSFFCYSARL